MSKRNVIGVVYSTNPDFQYQYDGEEEQETLPMERQRLRVKVEKHHRGGKTATVVTGFVGSEDDLQDLAKKIKTKCGVGGSAKDGEIIIQGELQQKVVSVLTALGVKDVR